MPLRSSLPFYVYLTDTMCKLFLVRDVVAVANRYHIPNQGECHGARLGALAYTSIIGRRCSNKKGCLNEYLS